MLPYIITFGLSGIFCLIAEDNSHKYRPRTARLFFFLAVLVASILAGCRDISVGPDTISYTTYFFDHIGTNFTNFKSCFLFYTQTYEPGFVIFEYVLSRIFSDSHWMLFWAAMIIYGFSLKSILKYKNQCSVSLVWILFLALTCTEVFNIIRQYMAMAIGMYGFTYAMERKYKRFIVLIIIAMSFHYGALIFIPIYYIYLYLKNKGIPILIVVGAVMALIALPRLTGLSSMGFIGMKVERYISDEGFQFQINPFLIRLPFLIYILFQRRLFVNGEKEPYYQIFERKHEGEFFVLLLIIELIFSQARGINTILYRFTSFFVFFKFIAYSRIVCLQKGTNRIVMKTILWIYIGIIFVYWVAIVNSGIYPYTSELLWIR